MKHTAYGFWRDEAKLPFLCLDKRLRFWGLLVGTMLSIGSVGVAVYQIWDCFAANPLAATFLIGNAVAVAILIGDILVCGGGAGARLMNEAKTLKDMEGPKTIARGTVKILDRVTFAVEEMLATAKNRPGAGMLDNPVDEVKIFDRSLRDKLVSCVETNNEEITKLSPDEVLVFHLEPDADISAIRRNSRKLLERIEAARSRLMGFGRN